MSARIRHLSKAPITEALIDIRVQQQEGLSVSVFDVVRAMLSESYPTIRPLQTVQAQFGVQDGQVLKPETTQTEAGILFWSADEKTVAQFRLDGFTFNKLQPYTSWSEIYPEAQRLWRVYRSVSKPSRITRLGARYINRLDLPSADFSRYLSALPQLPTELPQQARSFLTRVVLYDDKRDVSASLTQAFESPVEAAAINVLLDIDAFKEFQVPPSDSEIERSLESLHALKNEIFFGTITEETARIYE